MRERLYLVDGAAFAYRSYYAIHANLTDSKGRPTNAVYGFARILLKLLREEQPTHIAVVFDAYGPTFRHEAYADYKATRQETPRDLISQFPLMDTFVEALCIPLLRIEGVEADDVIGTLARRAEAKGMEAVIVTGDKDLLQLVSDAIKVYDPSKGDKGAWYTAAEVKERFGVGPDHVIDALGLMGDASDNVPGVKGIGEKTARKLLETHGSLDGIYEHLDKVTGRVHDLLEQSRDMAFLSRQLVTIDTRVPLDIDVDGCIRCAFDLPRVIEVFTDLSFQSMLKEFMPETDEQEELDYKLVITQDALAAAIAEMSQAGRFALRVQTAFPDAMRSALAGIALSCAEKTGYYIPVGHADEALVRQGADEDLFSRQIEPLDQTYVLDRLRPLFENPAIGKIGHDIKNEIVALARAGIRLDGIVLDTMVASYLTDASRLRHNLNEVSLQYLKRKTIPLTDVVGRGSKAVTFDKVPVETASVFACEFADLAGRLARVLEPLLRERDVERLFQEVELPLIGVLARMEMAGVAIDCAVFGRLQNEIAVRLKNLETEIYEMAGEVFQINSTKQLQAILFDKLKLAAKRKIKTGFSTDVDVLEELAQDHPLPKKILDYRMLEKLRSTYVEALPKLVNPETGRIHTSFNQAVAATGRLSSSEPNLQNIPARSDLGRRIREGFIAGNKTSRLISADYSQIELRILAHLSGDERLVEAFHRGDDIHRDTAARVFGVAPEDVTPEMRRQSKVVNFGVIYGISAFGLARNLGISTADAARFIDNYFAQYPGVQAWIDRTLEQARSQGYVVTLLNRRRYVPEINKADVPARKAAERIVVNTPVQGSAADVIKLAMVRLDAALRNSEARLVLQVHDELLVEAPAAQAPSAAATVKEIMENAAALNVPLKVDVGIGKNWAEIHS